MNKTENNRFRLVLYFTLLLSILGIQNSNSQEYCTKAGTDRVAGEQDGYRYELWNQNAQGTACITVGSEALFSGEWIDIQNYLARRGLGYDETQKHEEIGTFYTIYDCDYNPASGSAGNSYLSVYGWTVDQLIEFYVVEDWRNWIPSMDPNAEKRGEFTANGSVYDIYENTRVNQPSIVGPATFQQYFSIRRDERNSGTINISDHFKEWETQGMPLGFMYEVSFVVEGYMNSGSFEFTELDVFTNDGPLEATNTSTETEYVRVFPNPNSGDVSIVIDEAYQNASMKIFNTSGKIVFSEKNIANNQLQISNLSTGVYYLNVSSNLLNHNTKLLVF